MNNNPDVPDGWSELLTGEIIATDDRIWTWGTGPWKDVGGSLVGCRYNVPNSNEDTYWPIIRKNP